MKKNLLVMLAFFAATSFLPAQTLFNKAAFKVEKNNSDLLTVTAGKEVFKVHLVGGYIDMGKDKGFIFKDTFADAKGQAIQGAEKTKLRYQAARLVDGKLHLTLAGNIPNENFKDYFVFKRFEIAPEMQNIISVITFIGRNKNKAVKLPKDAALSSSKTSISSRRAISAAPANESKKNGSDCRSSTKLFPAKPPRENSNTPITLPGFNNISAAVNAANSVLTATPASIMRAGSMPRFHAAV